MKPANMEAANREMGVMPGKKMSIAALMRKKMKMGAAKPKAATAAC